MKKATKLLAGAALIVSLSTLSGCGKENIIDVPQPALYGPPPFTPEEETIEIITLTATPEAEMTEIPAPIYGPPPFTPEGEAIPTPTPTVTPIPTATPRLEEETFTPVPDPATEPVEEVYGPPPDEMDPQDNW